MDVEKKTRENGPRGILKKPQAVGAGIRTMPAGQLGSRRVQAVGQAVS